MPKPIVLVWCAVVAALGLFACKSENNGGQIPGAIDADSSDGVRRTDGPRADGPAKPGNGDGSSVDDGGSSTPVDPLACGGTGEPCCAGNGCRDGGCCVGGRCAAAGGTCAPIPGICSAGSCGTCGGLGKTCCGNSVCTESGTQCLGGVCAKCGAAAGDLCCAPAANAPVDRSNRYAGICSGVGITCSPNGGRCVACGMTGDPCCAGNVCGGGACCFAGQCISAGQNCGSGEMSGGTCSGGRCSGCGGRDQICCGEGTLGICHEARQTCRGNRCGACGGAGEVCCPLGGTTPPCGGGLICGAAGLCQTCGGAGEPCCPGNTCDGANCCLGTVCHAAGASCMVGGQRFGKCEAGRCGCGKTGEQCCPSYYDDRSSRETDRCTDPETSCTTNNGAGTCQKCGVAGGPCCLGQKCNESGTSCLRGGVPGLDLSCQRCGGPGDLCCPEGPRCNDADSECVYSGGGGERCQKCGEVGGPCCANQRCSGADSVCAGLGSSARCVKCGTATPGANYCCPGNRCTDGSCCISLTNNSDAPTCVAVGRQCAAGSGTCAAGGSCGGKCGGKDQPCCESAGYVFCSGSGTACVRSPGGVTATCMSCGKAGQPCCVASSSSQTRACEGALRCQYSSPNYLCVQ